ncbi:SOS response-associated peptidase [Variovorax sp. J22R115]|uniref:SOS response-associated peptidase n=1 Tax=Variovorax sp. J22R115 TaxID=3053509 RepID=UPI0025783B68|nr:SOS response-associated peptidase family protein [Variovorax sp. J22R115]MDM0048814.1 SOS response-associated peptidase family protein [Variovorax sp. J22R115]
MCSNYEAVSRADRLLSFFGVVRGRDDPIATVFPTGLAPFIRLAEDGSGNRIVHDGAFGLLPYFAKELAYGRRTYNARTETVATLPSFKDAWRRSQRCIIPAESIFEPSYETGKAVRWRIYQPGDVPMGIAGIYTKWRVPETGHELYSFAMLTVNAAGHPVMQRFHKAEDEKRMVVVLDPADYDAWLTCPLAQAPKFFSQWMGPLETYEAPLPPRAPRTYSGKVIQPPSEPGLF